AVSRSASAGSGANSIASGSTAPAVIRRWGDCSIARNHRAACGSIKAAPASGQGLWETWSLVSNFARDARQATTEYSRRFSCEEGFRDAKWYLGFKQARVKDIRAWSRLFALFVLALLILTTLGTFCLLRGDQRTKELLRRVASRRRDRCELSLVSAMLSLLQQDRSLLACLLSFTKFKPDTTMNNVS